MLPPDKNCDSTLVVTTMFDHGGVISYWKDVIKHTSAPTKWFFFTNQVSGVDPDPFKSPSVTCIQGLDWKNPVTSSWNFLRVIRDIRPQVVILNGTLAMLRIAPALVFLRFFYGKIKIKCVFHNGAIYRHRFKDAVNNIVVSSLSLLCHERIFVSQFVSTYWFAPGVVISRPFTPKAKSSYLMREPFRIGFLGRISHEKDPEFFLQTISLVQDHQAVVAEIAGQGPLQEYLMAKYSWATWHGWVNSSDWLPQIDLLLTTSLTEGWPMALGEALESGVPVLGISVGGVPEILRGAEKWLIEARSTTDLARLISDFLKTYQQSANQYFINLSQPSHSLKEWSARLAR